MGSQKKICPARLSTCLNYRQIHRVNFVSFLFHFAKTHSTLKQPSSPLAGSHRAGIWVHVNPGRKTQPAWKRTRTRGRERWEGSGEGKEEEWGIFLLKWKKRVLQPIYMPNRTGLTDPPANPNRPSVTLTQLLVVSPILVFTFYTPCLLLAPPVLYFLYFFFSFFLHAFFYFYCKSSHAYLFVCFYRIRFYVVYLFFRHLFYCRP